ncbi:MAG: alpha/beta fold hydrolase [Cyanobacteriota bacterium SKYGB_h_bin112]|nr:alpha/beta fold hydrolase [Cyanobacteriota bacterium SKYGB_h_bin112]
MIDYPSTTATLIQQTLERERTLPLLSEWCRSRFFFHPQPTDYVCLFFHGFTAAPHQFIPMSQMFFKAGYNVIVPLMPGHGQAGQWDKSNPPPLPTNPAQYQDFALYWLQIAQLLGRRVIVGGLSGGGTLAAWLSLYCPRAIYRTILFAPFLSSSNKVVDLFVKSFDGYFEWTQASAYERVPANIFGYSGFALPALRTFLVMGQTVLQAARSQFSPPLFIISSECDEAVGNYDHKTLFDRLIQRQPMTWKHCFSRALAIPHTMMTKAEGNQWENLLNVMVKAFVQSNLTWAELEEIGFRMTRGKTFKAVIAELGLQQNVSPDMPAMMTMLDKRAIVEARNSTHRRH